MHDDFGRVLSSGAVMRMWRNLLLSAVWLIGASFPALADGLSGLLGGGGLTTATRPASIVGNTTFFWKAPTSPAIWNPINDRVCIGGSACLNTGNVPENPQDWLNTIVPNSTQNAQLIALNTIGLIGIIGGSRSSDYPAQTGGSIGVAGYGYNDSTFTSSSWGGYFEDRRGSGVTGPTVGIEVDIKNAGSVVDITPHNFFPGTGITSGVWLATGNGSGSGNAATCALCILSNTDIFRKGIIFQSVALDTSIGNGGGGIAMELYTGQEQRWMNSSDTAIAELWGGSIGSVTGMITPNAMLIGAATSAGPNGVLNVKGTTNEWLTVGPAVSITGAIVLSGLNDAAGANIPMEFRVTTFNVVSNNVVSAIIGPGVQIGAPTGGDKGAGTINAAGLIYNNGTAPTGSAGGYVLATSPSLTTPTTDTLAVTGSTAPTNGIYLPAASTVGLVGATKLQFNAGASNVQDYNVTTASTWTLAAATTINNATFKVTTLAASTALDVVCYTTATGLFTEEPTATTCTVSDERKKTAMRPIDRKHSLDIVLASSPISYYYKPEAELDNNYHLGFGAQTLGRIAPELVQLDAGGEAEAVKQLELLPITWAAMQEEHAAIEGLRAEVAELRAALGLSAPRP